MSTGMALVTGASSGIGYELAKVLATKGYDLVIAAEDDGLRKAASDFQSLGARVTEVQADLATSDGVEKLWSQVKSSGGNLDVACINAGVGVGRLFAETDLKAELNMVQLNCASTVHLAKYVVRLMMSAGTGKILFTSSIAGEMVAPREAVYAATKAFVLSFAQSVRYELKDSGVTVTALQPGPTDTNFFHRAGMDNTETGQKGKNESEPEDVANQGIEALFDGKDHVYSASFKTKLEGMVANLVPGSMKGAMHEKMARPTTGS